MKSVSNMFRSTPLCLALIGFLAVLSTQAADSDSNGDKKKTDDANSSVKPYDEVIKESAQSKSGLFIAHFQDEKLFYEIKPAALNTDMLWVTQIAATTAGSSYAGMPAGSQVVRWEKRGDHILLRDVRYGIRAETEDPISIAVERSNLAPIIKSFEVKAYGKDLAAVIDVTELFVKDVAEFSAKNALDVGSMDDKRTFIEEIKTFPENINIKVLATYAPKNGNDRERSSGVTALIHHSMVKLPEEPMKPRRHDSRVGFFNVRFTDYAENTEHEADEVRYITRWRLEKKNPDAEVSEPKQPIVFYVGRETPEKWKSYVKAGIEQWQPAFEAAGFKNAIIGKYPPDPIEDPDWDPEDARISSIRWLPSSIENAFGPHVHDPRTGEILEADVRMYHNVQKLVRDWYFVQASPSDERAQKLPMPDELMGQLIQFVVAHEVGHSLGFPHNMKASSSYTVEQLRDPEWTKEHGTAPSIMDYARFNYVAQPGDGAALMPQIGPYDGFVVDWGYRQFGEDADEKAELEKLAKKQIDNPVLRFGGPNASLDSTQQTEDLGADAVEATRLGLQNLERVADNLIAATGKPGTDYDLLENMFQQLTAQWRREMGHVANVVGGVEEINRYFGDADQVYFPNSAEYQRKAVQFLNEHALAAPALLLDENVLGRISAEGVADTVLGAQKQILNSLLNDRRVKRMSEIMEREGESAYAPAALLNDLRNGVFSELESGGAINLYRRNLQRAMVERLASFLESSPEDSDLPALARQELAILADKLETGIDSASSSHSLRTAHLKDLAARIEEALDPKKD